MSRSDACKPSGQATIGTAAVPDQPVAKPQNRQQPPFRPRRRDRVDISSLWILVERGGVHVRFIVRGKERSVSTRSSRPIETETRAWRDRWSPWRRQRGWQSAFRIERDSGTIVWMSDQVRKKAPRAKRRPKRKLKNAMSYAFRPLARDAHARDRAKQHAFHFLVSSEVSPEVIKPVLHSGRGGTKIEIAELAATAAVDDTAVAKELALNWAKRPKKFLALYKGTPQARTPLRPLSDLVLRHLPGAEWHGPETDPSSGASYYVFTQSVPQRFIDDDGTPAQRFLRWACTAEVRDDYLALHWGNFTYAVNPHQPDTRGRSQYPYWKHLPMLVSDLNDYTATKWEAPPLKHFFLYELIEKYWERTTPYRWTHERVRSESRAVSLTASGRKTYKRSGSGSVEVDISGIEGLSAVLAEEALAALGIHDPSRQEPLSRKMLLALIRRFNPRSYQVELTEPDPSDSSGKKVLEHMFRGHVYFAAGPKKRDKKTGKEEETIDTQQHLTCFSKFGSSIGARDFLLKELREHKLW